MDVLGYLGGLMIGMVLGLLGGGGSILTVPILVYLIGIGPVLATAYSLFVVGVAALFGAIANLRKGQVSVKTAIIFAIPAFIAVYLTRLYLLPALPEMLFQVGKFKVTKDVGIMFFFAIIMFVAAFSMIFSKGSVQNENPENLVYNYPIIALEGLVIGTLTGIVGAGGGFLIIPALVLLVKLPMKLAVGTSLSIVAVKSLIGFIGDVQAGQQIDWIFLLTFTGFAVVGILIGSKLSNYIPGKKLRKSFGWFILLMAIFIIFKEISK